MVGPTSLRERGGGCKTRRIYLAVRVSYDDDLQRARDVLLKVLTMDARVLGNPPPSVTVRELADTGVDLNVRPWVNNPDYSSTKWDIAETIKGAFGQSGITIPYPQLDVHKARRKDPTS